MPTPTESNDTIQADEIQAILTKYNIGRKPLSVLLGWGQTTILRYLSGIRPTVEYSKELRLIKEQPSYYLSLLEKNKERITKLAYQKSRQAVQTLLVGSRLALIAQYIINRADGDISALRVQAILYYSQVFSLALEERPLFEDECNLHATAFIPYPEIYRSMRESRVGVLSLPEDALCQKDRLLIDQIYSTLEWYGPEAIRIVTSFERNALQRSVRRHKKSTSSDLLGVIPKSVLQKYFLAMLTKYNIKKPREINSYFNKRSIEYRKLKRH